MNSLKERDDAGDHSVIPIGPVESYNDKESLVAHHHHDKSLPIDSYFTFHETIGDGGFSVVKKATCKTTGETYAIKILDKSKIKEDDFPRVILEIETLASIKHPFIVTLHSVFYTRTKIYMVMEYCHTDLYEYLVKLDDLMSEAECRRIFVQILSALNYLHNIGIAHRDIKPENILLTKNNEIRLSDFGLASSIQTIQGGKVFEQLLVTYCGSLAYCAPEVLLGMPYCGKKADIWSLGVNLYVLLAIALPFEAETPNEVRARITTGKFHKKPYFSRKVVDLITRILQVDPKDRLSLKEIWEDPWIYEGKPVSLNLKIKSSRGHDTKKESNFNDTSNSPLDWCHKPACRSDPVELDILIRESRLRRLAHSTRNKLIKIKNFLLCHTHNPN